jgi:glyoxylate/hydroxypyruvate reductase A
MAQYVGYQVLRRFRGFARYETQAEERSWTRHPIPDARTHTVGIMGVGEIGRGVAATLQALGFRVTGWNRTGKDAQGVHRMHAGEMGLPGFLREADTLVCLLPFTPQTRGLLDLQLLSQLKPGAFLVNVARGGILVGADLLALLDSGHLSGAALDVFATEPLPGTDPLWRHPNLTNTPDIAAQPSVTAAVDQFIADLARLRDGRSLLHVIDRAQGY